MQNEVSYQFTIKGDLVELIEGYCRMIGMSKADFFRTAAFEKLMLFKTYLQVGNGQMPQAVLMSGANDMCQQQPTPAPAADMKQACITILNHPGFDKSRNEFVQGCLNALNSHRALSEKQQMKINQMHYRLTGSNADGSEPGKPCAVADAGGGRDMFPFSCQIIGHSASNALEFEPDNEDFKRLHAEACKQNPRSRASKELMELWLDTLPRMPVPAACFSIPDRDVLPDNKLKELRCQFHEIGIEGFEKEYQHVMKAFDRYVLKTGDTVFLPFWHDLNPNFYPICARKALQYMYEKAIGKR